MSGSFPEAGLDAEAPLLHGSGWPPGIANEGDEPAEVPAEARPDEPALARLKRWAGTVNIAEELPDDLRGEIAQRTHQDWRIDDDSRADWKHRYKEWMKLACQVAEQKTYPWPNASNVIFPLLTVAALQFSARAYPAIVRGSEVVRGKVDKTEAREAAMAQPGAPQAAPVPHLFSRAQRIAHHMSYQLLHEMDDWEAETDRLLIVLAITGTMFRKTYFDPAARKNMSRLVDADRIVIDFKAPSFRGAPRITEEIDLYPWEVEERIRGGVFLDQQYSQNNDMTMDRDAPITFLEQHRRWDLDGDGYAEPYIVTISKDGQQLARITAGYDLDTIFLLPGGEEIARVEAVPYYTRYLFVPHPESGVYGMGFGQLLYPINGSINSALNQLFDAGHLANAGGGFIGSGASLNSGRITFSVGEYKPVPTPGGVLRENIVPLPFPGPNPVLFTLVEFLVGAGKEIASIKDVLAGEMPGANVPGILGLAVIQQGLKVFSAVFRRVHRSLAEEYQKLFRLNRLYLPEQEDYVLGQQYFQISRQDYEKGSGVEPVSDPEVVTDAQQMARANFLLQFANDPWCNGGEIRRRAFEAAQISDMEKVLRAQPLPNPEIIARAGELHLRTERELGDQAIRRTRDKAAEVRDLAQGIMFLAQAKKADSEVDQGWIDRMLKKMELELASLENGPGDGNGAPGTAAPGVGGPPPAGLPPVAPPPGNGGGLALPGGLPGLPGG